MWKCPRVLLQYGDSVPTLEPTDGVAKANNTMGCIGAQWEGALEQLYGNLEADLIDSENIPHRGKYILL